MGSKGSKPRKPSHSQHLPKVGTAADNQRALHAKQQGMLNQFGLGNASKGTRVFVSVIAVLLVGGAILGLLMLTIWPG